MSMSGRDSKTRILIWTLLKEKIFQRMEQKSLQEEEHRQTNSPAVGITLMTIVMKTNYNSESRRKPELIENYPKHHKVSHRL